MNTLYAILIILVIKLIIDIRRNYESNYENDENDKNDKKNYLQKQKSNQERNKKSNQNVENFTKINTNDNRKTKIKFNPVISNNSKYKLYGDNFMVSQPAGKIDCKYDFNQLINTNIINHVNKSDDDKTIRDIYNEMTNDHRLEYQQNLDELEGYDDRSDYEISYGTKYGSTRFDTFNVKPL
jgi:hypothetical protein